MSTKDTNKFMASLPRGPMVHLLGQVHAIAHYLPETGRVGLSPEHMLTALEYSLRRIAENTAEPEPYYQGVPLDDQRRPLGGIDRINWGKVGQTIREAAKVAFSDLQGTLGRVQRASEAVRNAALTPEQRDRRSQSVYELAVAAERRNGLAYVEQVTTDVINSIPWWREEI